MINRITLFTVVMFFSLLALSVGTASEVKEPLPLAKLMAGIEKYEKKEVSLVGTVAGACNSGCKVWVADGEYKQGDPVALVWAKDKAFTFKTDVTGQKVLLEGYAVGKYVDLCAVEKEKKSDEEKAENGCNPIIDTETGQKQLRSITFFATSLEYLK